MAGWLAGFLPPRLPALGTCNTQHIESNRPLPGSINHPTNQSNAPSHHHPCLPAPLLQTLAREFLHNPYQVIIGSADLKANHRISQVFEFPAEHEKYHKLVRILEKVRGHLCCCRCRGGCGRRAGAAGVWE